MYKVLGGDQQEYGPATAEEVRQWIVEGRLSGQSLAKVEDATEWSPLSSFDEFADALRAQAAQFLAATASSLDAQEGILEDRPTEPKVRIGRCLVRSAELIMGNFGSLVAATSLVWLLSMVCQFTPLVGGILNMLLSGVLFGGLYLVFLRRIRGQQTNISEVFTGFGDGFAQLMLAGFVTSLLSSIGMLFCVLPWLYLHVAWSFAVPLVADKRMEFWSAMERSRRKVNRVWFSMLGLLTVAFLPVILMYIFTQAEIFALTYPTMRELMASGQPPDYNRLLELLTNVARQSVPLIFLNKLVLLLNLPFAAGAVMFAYEDLFGKDSGEA